MPYRLQTLTNIMKKLLAIACISIMVMSIFSCSKSDESTITATPSKADMLLYKRWQKTAQNIRPAKLINGKEVTDLFAEENTCSRDNLFLFYEDKTYDCVEGFSRCNSTDPDLTAIGTWEIAEDETRLNMFSAIGLKSTNKILEFSESKIVLESYQLEDGVFYATITTYESK